MRILLGRANSSNVMKVIWLLEELGLPYERRDVGGPFGGTAIPEYRARNPNGVVPTLVEDDFSLWESNVILRYLATAPGQDTPVWPHDPRARAHVDQWMDWQQTTLNRPHSTVFQGLVRIAPEKRDLTAIQAAADELRRYYGLLNDTLATRPYIAGATFSLADIAIGVHAHRWLSFDLMRPQHTHLTAWYERLLDRPAYALHVAQPMT